MGRKKTYDREEAAEQALQVFWQKGFERTSLRDLEAATGVNRYGLYDSFVDKEGLFRECIERYCSANETMLEELAPRGLDGLVQMIERFAEPASEDKTCRLGCMVVTAQLERDALSPPVHRRLNRFTKKLLEHIRKVLESERQSGTLREGLQVDECAEFVHLFLVGLPTMRRISSNGTGMRLAARAAIGTMRSWRV